MEAAPHLDRLFLLGPTASGKSTVALEVAEPLGAEILTLDSMQVYRGMDLGTAKPTPEERNRIRHHLLDLIEPHEEYSVARFVQDARRVEDEVRARGKRPLYVGGTGLYLKALVSGLLQGPSIPAATRQAVVDELAQPGGRDRLREELARVDPKVHARIHSNDDKRLLRAIETWRATGRPLGDWQQEWGGSPEIGSPAVALRWPREALRDRVEQRFDAMLAAGFLEEVRAIRAGRGFGDSARKALGYQQLLEHLEGRCSLQEARQKAITLTRTLIRRQMTWLRSFPDLYWVDVDPEHSLAATVAPIFDYFTKR